MPLRSAPRARDGAGVARPRAETRSGTTLALSRPPARAERTAGDL